MARILEIDCRIWFLAGIRGRFAAVEELDSRADYGVASKLELSRLLKAHGLN